MSAIDDKPETPLDKVLTWFEQHASTINEQVYACDARAEVAALRRERDNLWSKLAASKDVLEQAIYAAASEAWSMRSRRTRRYRRSGESGTICGCACIGR